LLTGRDSDRCANGPVVSVHHIVNMQVSVGRHNYVHIVFDITLLATRHSTQNGNIYLNGRLSFDLINIQIVTLLQAEIDLPSDLLILFGGNGCGLFYIQHINVC